MTWFSKIRTALAPKPADSAPEPQPQPSEAPRPQPPQEPEPESPPADTLAPEIPSPAGREPHPQAAPHDPFEDATPPASVAPAHEAPAESEPGPQDALAQSAPAAAASGEPADATPQPRPAAEYREQLARLLDANQLEEAGRLLQEMPAKLRTQLWAMLSGLRLGIASADDGLVASATASLCARARTNVTGLRLAARMLRQAGRLDALDAVLSRWTVVAPDSEPAWREAAALASQRGQPARAAERYASLAALPGATQDDVYDAVTAAEAAGQHDLARRLAGIVKAEEAAADPAGQATAARPATAAELPDIAAQKLARRAAQTPARGAALKPEDPALAVRAALALLVKRRTRTRRIATVLARLATLRELFPNHLGAYTATLDALRESGGAGQAEQLATQWAPQWGDKPDFILARLRIAQQRGDHETALAQIQDARTRLKADPVLEAALVQVLARQDRYAEADSAAQAGLRQFPANRHLLREHAKAAARQGDLQQALERWTQAEQASPSDPSIKRELQALRTQVGAR